MNRSDVVKGIVWLDQIAAQAKVEAAKLREQLDAEARAEYEEQGTAPTWRMPDIATVALSVSKETVYVSDAEAFAKWVQLRYPEQIHTVTETRVRSSWQQVFFERHVQGDEETVADTATGEVIPGVAMRAGGRAMGVSIRPTTEVKRVYAAVAEQALKQLAVSAGPSAVVVLAELEASDG